METIRRLNSRAEKDTCWDLLLLADAERQAVEKYLDPGEMFVLYQGDLAVTEAVMLPREDGHIELKSLATDPGHQKQGCAGRLLKFLFDEYKGKYDKMFVGTAFEGLYEQWGFTYAYTVKNFFVDNYEEPVIDEGRLCVDMIYFERDLGQ